MFPSTAPPCRVVSRFREVSAQRTPFLADFFNFRRASGRWHSLLWGLVLTAGGCAPSLATLQPAHVAPAGHLQAAVGVEIGIPTGSIAKTVDAVRTLASDARTQTITDAQKVQLLDAGITLASNPPSVGQRLSIAYTPIERMEVNLQYLGAAWRLGGRFQLLNRDTGPFDLVAGLGISRLAQAIPIEDVLPVVKVDDFTRWSIDVPVLLGTSRDWFRVWGGPRFLFSQVATNMRLELVDGERVLASFRASGVYFGAQGGLAVGYRSVFLGVELTVTELVASAEVTSPLPAANRTVDIGGLVITPAFALMGEF